jgi:fluoride exporter
MRLLLLAMGGGALGAGARYLVNVLCARCMAPGFPWATLIVNIFGSLLMGVVVEVVARRFGGSVEARTFLATGILGGFTTFSAFALDAANLMNRGDNGLALAYVLGSVVLSILGLYAGLGLARHFFP